MTDLEAMKAAFLAKGGTVSKVAEGEGLGLSNYAWNKRMQDQPVVREYSDVQMAEQRVERLREENGYFKS